MATHHGMNMKYYADGGSALRARIHLFTTDQINIELRIEQAILAGDTAEQLRYQRLLPRIEALLADFREQLTNLETSTN